MHQRSPAYATPHFRWLTQLYDIPNVAPSLVQGTPTLHSRPGDARKRHGARERVLCVDTGCIKCRTLVATPSEPTQAQKTITQMQRICASRALISTRIPSDEEAKEHRQKKWVTPIAASNAQNKGTSTAPSSKSLQIAHVVPGARVRLNVMGGTFVQRLGLPHPRSKNFRSTYMSKNTSYTPSKYRKLLRPS